MITLISKFLYSKYSITNTTTIKTSKNESKWINSNIDFFTNNWTYQ
jgi:hypothetical protein